MDIAVTDIDQTITDCLVDASFVEESNHCGLSAS